MTAWIVWRKDALVSAGKLMMSSVELQFPYSFVLSCRRTNSAKDRFFRDIFRNTGSVSVCSEADVVRPHFSTLMTLIMWSGFVLPVVTSIYRGQLYFSCVRLTILANS